MDRGREGRQPGVTASQRQEEAKTAKRGRRSGGRNAEGGCVQALRVQCFALFKPSSRVNLFLVSSLSSLALAFSRFIPCPAAFLSFRRLPSPFSREKKILTTEEKLISTAGSRRFDVAPSMRDIKRGEKRRGFSNSKRLMFNTKGFERNISRFTFNRFGEYFWIGYDSRFGYKPRGSLSWRSFYFSLLPRRG